jgi:hypothetical protein
MNIGRFAEVVNFYYPWASTRPLSMYNRVGVKRESSEGRKLDPRNSVVSQGNSSDWIQSLQFPLFSRPGPLDSAQALGLH